MRIGDALFDLGEHLVSEASESLPHVVNFFNDNFCDNIQIYSNWLVCELIRYFYALFKLRDMKNGVWKKFWCLS